MFVIELTYKNSREDILSFLQAHNKYLDAGYAAGHFLYSGPKPTKDGGVIIAEFSDLQSCNEFIAKDPFVSEGLANINIIKFAATKQKY